MLWSFVSHKPFQVVLKMYIYIKATNETKSAYKTLTLSVFHFAYVFIALNGYSFQNILESSHRAHGIETTSHQRRCNVMILHPDVQPTLTLRGRWIINLHFLVDIFYLTFATAIFRKTG